MGQRIIWVGAAGSTTGFGIIRSLSAAFGERVRLIGADTNPPHLVAASVFAHASEQVPPAAAPDFLARLLERWEAHGVDTYIPVHDGEILAAARAREQGLLPAGVAVLAPSLRAVSQCNDKIATCAALRSAGIVTPDTVLLGEAQWREGGWLRKQRSGVGSIGVQLLRTPAELAAAQQAGGDYVVQTPCLSGETTIDTFKSRHSGYFRAVARERLEIKAGVCSKARLYPDPELAALAEAVADAMELRGAFNVQVMRDSAGRWSVIDVNPRTGGATSMCNLLGIQFAAANAADLWGEPVEHLLPALAGERHVVRQPTDFLTQ